MHRSRMKVGLFIILYRCEVALFGVHRLRLLVCFLVLRRIHEVLLGFCPSDALRVYTGFGPDT